MSIETQDPGKVEHVESRPIDAKSPDEAAAGIMDALQGAGVFGDEEQPPVEAPQEAAPPEETPLATESPNEVEASEVEDAEEVIEAEVAVDVAPPKPPVVDAETIRAREQLNFERNQATTVLQKYLQATPVPTPPKAELIDEDPMEYMRQNARHTEALATNTQAQQELQNLQAQAFQGFVQEESAKLQTDLPQLFHPETGDQLRQDIREFAHSQGFDDNALNGVSANEVKLLYSAMSYQNMQAKAPAAKQALKAAPPVVKAQASTPAPNPKSEAAQRSRQAFKESGDTDDMSAYLLQTGAFD